MENNTQLPAEVVNKIEQEAHNATSALYSPNNYDEFTFFRSGWEKGATAYASKLTELQQENASLKDWKHSALAILNPLWDYADKHLNVPLGEIKTEAMIKRIKELEHQNDKLKERATGWVKASTPGIKDGHYVAKYKPDDIQFAYDPVGMAFVDADRIHFVCPSLYDIEWAKGHEELKYLQLLDEQPAAEPLTENARYELRLALRDMIKLVKRIYGDSAIPAEHQKRLDAADGLLQKHSKITDVLRTPAAGREDDAVEFVNWTLSSECDTYTCTDEDQWTNIYTQENITTAELYELFKQQKEKI